MATTTVTLWGIINPNGSTLVGSGGFNSSLGDAGEYTITFSPTFSDVPAIVGSQVKYGNTSESTLDNVVFPFVDSSSATAMTGDSSGKKTDRHFSFIAIGKMDE